MRQMGHQVGSVSGQIVTETSRELVKFIGDIEEAHKFALEETASFGKYMEGASDACLAGLPTTIPQILNTADDFLVRCVDLVAAQGEEIERNYTESFQGYYAGAYDLNVLFARDYFKRPEEVLSTALYNQLRTSNQQKAIFWDNVDSINLYNMRQQGELESVDDNLNKCILDMKEFVATELGRIFLYFWDC